MFDKLCGQFSWVAGIGLNNRTWGRGVKTVLCPLANMFNSATFFICLFKASSSVVVVGPCLSFLFKAIVYIID